MQGLPSSSPLRQFKGQSRLPSFAIPKRYDLTLKPDLTACVFSGSVEIDVDVVSPTRFLVLNALDICVDSGSVIFKNRQDFRAVEVFLEEEDEILVLGFNADLPIGKGVLGIEFSGVLNDHMRGFYRSKFIVDGIERCMAITQFEAVEARRCFPCWDEPALKATFKITLEVPSDLTALSNMPASKEIVNGLLKTVYFEESPVMSTYLVAVVVGLFDSIEDSTTDGIKVCVYCPIGKSEQGKFGLSVAIRSLELFKKYFSVPYALPKLDLVVIPDFSGGAMENYGLITFRDTALLYDESYSAAANKQWIATAVSHEVAHQWFGNLVTMELWTHLWLNEGFATWVSYLAINEFFPDWNIWTQFLDGTVGGLKLDALTESHPIVVEVLQARGVDQIFDEISYKKGSAVIRMLEAYLGNDVFQKSLASYVKRYACQNAKTEDLWDAITEESGVPVRMMMETWTKQKGYPVVNVKSNGYLLEFEQRQFSFSGVMENSNWTVPITLCFGSYDISQNFLLESRAQQLDVSKFIRQPETDGSTNIDNFWVKVNVEQTGFYRVKYDDILAGRLRAAIEGKCLHATDRFGCRLELQKLHYAMWHRYSLNLATQALSRASSSRLPLFQIINPASPFLAGESKLSLFLLRSCLLTFRRLGWDNLTGESHQNALTRGELLTALVMLGEDRTQKEEIRRYHIFLEDNNSLLLPPDIRKATFTAIMRGVTTANKCGLESLIEVYRKTDIAQEKGRILRAMSSCPDPDIVVEALNFLLSSEVRDQDVIYGLAGISYEGSEAAWNWLKENWGTISARWGHHFLITHFICGIVNLFCTEDKADEIESFFASRTKPSIARTVKQSIEQVRVNAKWVSNMRREHDLAESIAKLAQKNT